MRHGTNPVQVEEMLLEELCGSKYYKCSMEQSKTGEQEYTCGVDECGLCRDTLEVRADGCIDSEVGVPTLATL